ncbi:hypothetical protein [Pseudoalteromonas sp. Of11M-6]|nr:hypothetical protein [Pseudoalteromonas sp. Of11M-6]MCG7556190.1 hypothetical protein [Pseudoalteromonas sp. Of11M-6]
MEVIPICFTYMDVGALAIAGCGNAYNHQGRVNKLPSPEVPIELTFHQI